MQIVIDIPEEVKHKIYAYGLSLCPSDKEQLINAIMNGTPIEAELATKTCNKQIASKLVASEDAISRQAALEKIHWLGLDNDTAIKCDLAIRALPSVNPQPKTGWIPVSEGLPEDGTWNLFTDGKQVSVERYKADALDHFYPNGRWFSLDEAIAWMPLPEPYKAESEEQA